MESLYPDFIGCVLYQELPFDKTSWIFIHKMSSNRKTDRDRHLDGEGGRVIGLIDSWAGTHLVCRREDTDCVRNDHHSVHLNYVRHRRHRNFDLQPQIITLHRSIRPFSAWHLNTGTTYSYNTTPLVHRFCYIPYSDIRPGRGGGKQPSLLLTESNVKHKLHNLSTAAHLVYQFDIIYKSENVLQHIVSLGVRRWHFSHVVNKFIITYAKFPHDSVHQ